MPTHPTMNEPTRQSPVRPGLIDIHSHLIPGVDDGCATIEQTLLTVRRLIEAGYVGSFCTPHIWPGSDRFADNLPPRIAEQTRWLRQELRQAGLNYALWPGGELRLDEGVETWLEEHGAPVLGHSRCVLVDLWVSRWPRWADRALDWLLERGYTPILAHPERLGIDAEALDRQMRRQRSRGVRLQGNFQSMTGQNGYQAETLIRRWLDEQRLDFMALDLHRPDSISSRLDGLALVEAEFGPEQIRELTDLAPRKWLGLPSQT